MKASKKNPIKRALAGALVVSQFWLPIGNQALAATAISDVPIAAINNVPPNLMLTLSVEFPTGNVAAYNDNASNDPPCPGRDNGIGVCYRQNRPYLGYFDPTFCYTYNTAEYFEPTSRTANHACSGTTWSGNFLNWATMHAIDEFRFAMTGGDRVPGLDTAALTVIEKANHSGRGGYGQFPIKRIGPGFGSDPAVSPSTVTPKSWGTLYARVTNDDTPPQISKPGVPDSQGRVLQISNDVTFSTNVETYLVRVKVCDPNFLPSAESRATCSLYGSGYKPIGLMQQNADKMRFGVTSYLNDSNQSRPGGVIRSRMKFVGPQNIVPNGTSTTNPNAEISSDGTFPLNPDGVAESGVTGSGVINYLNKFGKVSGYKEFDTLSEMFYEATRYMRNLSATPEYGASTASTAEKDGFPVLTGWENLDQTNAQNRPIQYACQKTFFLGIADSNTWCDSLVPGNTLTGTCAGHAGALADPNNIDVTALDNAIGQMENGLPNFGTALGTTFIDGGRKDTFHVAGLGYWANTHNLLASNTDPDKPTSAQSYWVDVAETGSFGHDNDDPRNQMWLASKYGGFDNTDANGNLKTAPATASNADWDKDNDGTPDNYFSGDRPDRLIDALGSVFQNVNDKTLSGAGVSISTQNLAVSGSSYEVSYSTRDWTGDVTGNILTLDTAGNPVETNVWSAQAKLDTQAASTGWDTSRRIVTSNGSISSINTGIPFRLNSLTTTQQGYLGNAANRQDLLNYLRGDKSNEASKFRKRSHLLGDIIHSEATFAGPPNEGYSDSANPGFSDFTKSAGIVDRKLMIYVGANDGMLHAINASTSDTANGGNEEWAYIPSFVLSGPSSPATPDVDGLAARAKLFGWQHKFYVDQTPSVRSVDFARTCTTAPGGCDFVTSPPTPDWHTILVAGLNKGGRGYYAIDVTNPADWSNEAAVAGKVLWEFTDEDMGYTFGRPIIVKTLKYGWVVIVTSGYNNTFGSVAANRGHGFLYILNAKTGALLEKIKTENLTVTPTVNDGGSATSPSGFAFADGFIPDFTSWTVEQVYGGDLNGNLWRFDLTATTGSYPPPEKIAILTDGNNNLQSVTVEPRIEIDPNGVSRWVFIGTGRLLDTTDLSSAQTQTFYALRDGTVTAPYTAATLPNGLTSFPITRASMTANPLVTDPNTGQTVFQGVPAGTQFWYHDLTHTSGAGTTERIITNTLTANAGVISWIGQTPSSDPCSPTITSSIYATTFATGTSILTDVNSPTNVVALYSVPPEESFALKVVFTKDSSGNIRAIYSTGKGQLKKLPIANVGNPAVRLNWREVLQ